MRMSSNSGKPEKASSPTPTVVYTSKIRAIGNSRGVILNSQLMETAGLIADEDIVIRASDGLITIQRAEKPAVNTNLSTWDKQFKAAVKAVAKPEGDLFDGIENEFDAK
jgi:antitoxin component of MazEF toxin-antitoxin module